MAIQILVMVERMNSYRINDNTQRNKNEFSIIPRLTERIADRTLKQLEREGLFVFPPILDTAEDLSDEQMILSSRNDDYCTGNVMGYLGYGTERLTIGSRFGTDGQDFFFQYLLNRVLEFPTMVDLKTDADHESQLFNLFLFLFPYYLKRAMRKGPFKEYIYCKYNDGNVKGTIDVARHIAQNTPFIGRVAYGQREFSFDNSLMELIRHTIEYIKGKPLGSNLLFKVKDEVKVVVEATPGYQPYDRMKVIRDNDRNMVRHGYYREYQELQRLCVMILRHRKHRIGTGFHQMYGILFDGAWLWEEYVNSLVDDLFYHPRNKARKGAQQLFDGNVGLIFPDFISRDSGTRVIADAKYKPIGNIANQDYLQVLAYMFRFDAKEGYYFYPEKGDADGRKLRLNHGSTYEGTVEPRADIFVMKHGLKIPTGMDNYESFVLEMQRSESEFCRKLRGE